MQVLCFGDSITYGMWDSQGGWVTRLRSDIDKHIFAKEFLQWHEIFNLGISGNFTKDVLARAKQESISRLLIEPKAIALIGVGINDTKYGKDSAISSPTRYARQLTQLHNTVASFTSAQIYIGLSPVDEAIYGTKRWLAQESAFSNQRIEQFDQVLRKHAQAEKAIYVPLIKLFTRDDHTKLLRDGIHPNDQGHELIYEQIKPVVFEVLGLS